MFPAGVADYEPFRVQLVLKRCSVSGLDMLHVVHVFELAWSLIIQCKHTFSIDSLRYQISSSESKW